MASEANEPGSESGKRSDDRRGAARRMRAGSWSPQEGGASSHLAARLPPRSPGSFAAAGMATRAASLPMQASLLVRRLHFVVGKGGVGKMTYEAVVSLMLVVA